MQEGDFRAVVTFLPREQIRTYIEECVAAAAQAVLADRRPSEVKRRLLEHSLQRFRLSYLLGTSSGAAEEDVPRDEEDEDDNLAEEASDELAIPMADRMAMAERLDRYLDAVTALARAAHGEVAATLDAAPTNRQEQEAFEELVEEHLYECDDFHDLIDELLEDVESRFELLINGKLQRDEGGWPSYWMVKMSDRAEFLKTINRFSINYAPQFGRLLTPLVQGIRVAGPFKPDWAGDASPRLVLMDGEGLGHTAESAASLPTEITRRFEKADAILLVDSAPQPMQAAPTGVLRSLIASGHEPKLIICFTHFDGVRGDNLPDVEARRAHVLNSLDSAIDTVSRDFGPRVANIVKASLAERTLFLANIHQPLRAAAGRTRNEFLQLLRAFETTIIPPSPTTVAPVYNDSYLVLSIRSAVRDFHGPWLGRLGLEPRPGITAEHWTRIKALARRPAEFREEGYDTLRPVADLLRELDEHIAMFLSKPLAWEPEGASEEMCRTAINQIAREVYSHLHRFASDRLIGDQRITGWQDAYGLRGYGSARTRAREIAGIYRLAAPIPDEPVDAETDRFVTEVRELVREAVRAGGGHLLTRCGPCPRG